MSPMRTLVLLAALLLLPASAIADDASPASEGWLCRPGPGPGPSMLPDWAFALPEGTLQVEVVARTPLSARGPDPRWATLEEGKPAVLKVTANTVALQRFADSLSSATGTPIYVAPELQHLRVTQFHPAGRLSEILEQLRVAPIRVEVEGARVALRASGDALVTRAEVQKRSIVVPVRSGSPSHLRDLWCNVSGTSADPAGVVDASVVITGALADIERTRTTWTDVLAAGGGAGDAWSCRWTPGTRPIPAANPSAAGTLSLEVVGGGARSTGLFGAPDALFDIAAEGVAFGDLALGLAKALDVPTSIDPRLHTTRVSLRLTAASMEDLGVALAQRWSVHPGDDGHGNTLWDSWRPSHALGSWHLPTQEKRTVVLSVGDAITARQLAESSCELLSEHGSLMSTGEALVVRDLEGPLRRIGELAGQAARTADLP